VLTQPLLIVIEAKEDDFSKGWGQCLAAMVAAQRINHNLDLGIFGIVTNGETWQFGRLRRNRFEQEDTAVPRSNAFDYLNVIFATVTNDVIAHSTPTVVSPE
jgi:hypothetical protein